MSVKSKEDIATTLINIMQKEERAITFLVSLILSDIQRIGDKKSVDFCFFGFCFIYTFCILSCDIGIFNGL